MKTLSLFIFYSFFSFQFIKSQDVIITRPYDSTWIPVKSDSAFYICDYKKHDTLFLCECYWKSTNKLRRISMQKQMNLYSKTIGLEVMYFDDNNVEKISSFDEKGR